mgnify:CR=1 FL=1
MNIPPVAQAAGVSAVKPDVKGAQFDQALARSKGEQEPAADSAWKGEWERRVEARDSAKASGNDALAQHFQAELDVMKPVMAVVAPGVDTKQGAGADSKETQKAPADGVTPEEGGKAPTQKHPNKSESASSASEGDKVGNQKGLHLPPQLEQYKEAIQAASSASGIPGNVIAGMIWDESRGDIGALTVNGGNGLGDTGLMQVNPETFKELQKQYPDQLGGKELSDPATNIMAGSLYVKQQKADFGNLDLALRAYNSGALNVNPNDVSDISKYGTGTANYVEKVNKNAEIIGSGKGELPA